MDDSTSTTNAGLDMSSYVSDLLTSILNHNPGIELNVGIVKFKGYACDPLNGLVTYSDSTKQKIIDAINYDFDAHGSNAHSGLIMAHELLQKSDTEKDHKYVVFLTDGKNYIWNNEKNEPVTYYTQAVSQKTVQKSGKPVLNQIYNDYNREQGETYYKIPGVTNMSSLNDLFIFIPDSIPTNTNYTTSDYYQNIYDSNNEELKSTSTKYDEPAYYSGFYTYTGNPTEGDGTVTVREISNASELIGTSITYDPYRTYYDYVPDDTTFWKDIDYLQLNPFEVIENEDGTYSYDKDKVNEDFWLWHPDCMLKGLYQVGHYWKETICPNYKTAVLAIYATKSGGGTHPAGSFTHWVAENSDLGVAIEKSAKNDPVDPSKIVELFEGIDNSIRYMVSSGVVTDVIEDPFTLVEHEKKEDDFRMTLNGEALTGSFADGKWNFGAPKEGVYPYVVEYDESTKTITWEINVEVENTKPITLSYDLELPEDATTGKYPTNKSAVLKYTSSDGNKDGTYTFEVPEVSYIACTKINVEKVWEDEDDAAKARPDKVEVTLKDDKGESVATLVLDADGDWTGVFKHDNDQKHIAIPDSRLENGKFVAITYTVEEADVENYDSTVSGNAKDGFVITNKYVPPTTEEETTKAESTEAESTEAKTTEAESTEEETTPETGDSMNLLPFAMTLVLARFLCG